MPCFDASAVIVHLDESYIFECLYNTGKPRYVEQNKENGKPYHSTIPAEIVYCQEAEAWVFRHSKIRANLDEDYLVSQDVFG